MSFISTRGGACVTASQAILRGLAPDGGLYVPAVFPQMTLADIAALTKLDYRARALTILRGYLDDFNVQELADAIASAYEAAKFDDAAIAPTKKLDSNTHVLELFHGPTLAFKDMALQLLPHLTTLSAKKNGENREVAILVATSGDTGKAALAGFADAPGTGITVFYPEGKVSRVQNLQMSTQEGDNVAVCGIRGNFDDAQTGVKEIFAACKDKDLHGAMLSSANSINIGRLAPQVVYYFRAYGDLVKSGRIRLGDVVDYTVPTGNFGDILAGYFARQMGLPVGRLICASNANDVLTEFLTTGRYDKRRPFYKTTSPSMDILVSSNLERLLYLVSQDASCVERLMRELNTQGWYQVSGWMLEQLRAVFGCGCCDDAGAAEVIGRVWREHKYLCDPHTAVAWAVAEKHTREGVPMVVLSTASPYKFPAAVLHALGEASGDDEFAMMEQLHALTGMDIPKNLRGLEGRPVLHTDVIDKDAMLDYVLSDVLK